MLKLSVNALCSQSHVLQQRRNRNYRSTYHKARLSANFLRQSTRVVPCSVRLETEIEFCLGNSKHIWNWLSSWGTHFDLRWCQRSPCFSRCLFRNRAQEEQNSEKRKKFYLPTAKRPAQFESTDNSKDMPVKYQFESDRDHWAENVLTTLTLQRTKIRPCSVETRVWRKVARHGDWEFRMGH